MLYVNGKTRVIGIFGDPVSHSLSPTMHNAAFRHLKIPYLYVPFHVRPNDLAESAGAIRSLQIHGINVTLPHKETILGHLDVLSENARLCNAVNTVVNRDGKLYGDNTDGQGFLRSLDERGRKVTNRRALLIGAGGASRSVLVALIQAGCLQVTIVNRNIRRAEALAQAYRDLGQTEVTVASLNDAADPALLSPMSLVVNGLPGHVQKDCLPTLPYEATTRRCLFYDLFYQTLPTAFLVGAQQAQRPLMDGRRMLLHQGALAFKLWTGKDAPVRIMSAALTRALSTT